MAVILALDNFPIMSFDLEWSLQLSSCILCSRSVRGFELAVYFLCQFTRSIKMKPTVLFPFQRAVQEGRNGLRILFPNFFSWTWNSVLSKKLVKLSFGLAMLCCSLLASNPSLFLLNLTYWVLLGFFRLWLQNESAYKVFMNSCYEPAASYCTMTHFCKQSSCSVFWLLAVAFWACVGFFSLLVLLELMPSTFANFEPGSVQGGSFHLLFTEIVSIHCSTSHSEGLCNKTPQDIL